MSERLAGILLPAFSPRRDGDLGIGDTRSMREWVDLASEHGLRFIQLLPINESGSDDSPYNAISSVALEPAYLACEGIPGLEEGDLERARAELSVSVAVDYAQVHRLKWGLLALAWSRWDGADGEMVASFREFCVLEADWLEDYCVYRWLMEQADGSEVWDQWPEAWRDPAGARRYLSACRNKDEPGVRSRLDFFAWVQWLCFGQWRDLKAHADERGVKLMGDIPIGVSRYSADVFFGQQDFDLDWCGGAPPEKMFKYDRFIKKWGQNWGIPLYRWDKMAADGFPWWRQRISKLTDVFHIFRIDHILGFYRIYAFPWQPQRNDEFLKLSKKTARTRTGGVLPGWAPRSDSNKKKRAANLADGDLRLKAILDAAGDAAVVGEDLGCVPEYVRPHLQSIGIAGFRIPHWDVGKDGLVVPGELLPECSFATYATHDHEPLGAMWDELWSESQDPEEEPTLREKATESLSRLADFGRIEEQGPYNSEIQWRMIDALMASRSRYAAILVNDIFGGRERINLPGTVGPENWTYRFPWNVSDCADRKEWKLLERSLKAGHRAC